MVAPKKKIMGRGESAVSIGRARKPIVRVQPPKPKKVSQPTSNVKVKTKSTNTTSETTKKTVKEVEKRRGAKPAVLTRQQKLARFKNKFPDLFK